MKNKGHENLIPKTTLSEGEAKALGKKGGKKSGESRRRSKSIRQALEVALKGEYEVIGKTLSGYDAMAVQMILQAVSGNVQAFKEVRDSIGEKPTDKVEMTNSLNPAREKEIEEFFRNNKPDTR